MSSRRKEMLAMVGVVVLFLGAYLALREQRKATPPPKPAPSVEQPVNPTQAPTLPATSAPTLTEQQAVEIARRFCDAVGWKADGDLKVKFRHLGSYGPAWDVTWLSAPRHDHEWTVGVHTQSGQILGAMESYVGNSQRAHSGPPDLLVSQLVDSATRFAQAAGLPADYRLVQGKLSPGQAGQEEFIVKFGRYFGDAIYNDDLMTLWLHPDTGLVSHMGFRCRMQPPPDVPRNITQKQAEELGKKCLADPAIMGSAAMKVHSVNKVELKVVSPGNGNPMVPARAHTDEPSRIAWVVEYSRPGGHVAEAWIDVEDGSFLGAEFCG